MAQYKLKIYHLYPNLMNLYGDRGNILTLQKRCKWRDIEVEVLEVDLNSKPDFKKADLIFMGGGQDREQKIIKNDLLKLGPYIKEEIENGLVGLVICGGYQLFGQYFKTRMGEILKGIGVFDAFTIGGSRRMIGNAIVEASFGKLVGFENHSGKTYLAKNIKPLGKVTKGYGNNGEDEKEGTIYKNLFGTYLHGPILPKNPQFADLLLEKALKRKYGSSFKLVSLDNHYENLAHSFAEKRAYTAKTLHI